MALVCNGIFFVFFYSWLSSVCVTNSCCNFQFVSDMISILMLILQKSEQRHWGFQIDKMFGSPLSSLAFHFSSGFNHFSIHTCTIFMHTLKSRGIVVLYFPNSGNQRLMRMVRMSWLYSHNVNRLCIVFCMVWNCVSYARSIPAINNTNACFELEEYIGKKISLASLHLSIWYTFCHLWIDDIWFMLYFVAEILHTIIRIREYISFYQFLGPQSKMVGSKSAYQSEATHIDWMRIGTKLGLLVLEMWSFHQFYCIK